MAKVTSKSKATSKTTVSPYAEQLEALAAVAESLDTLAATPGLTRDERIEACGFANDVEKVIVAYTPAPEPEAKSK